MVCGGGGGGGGGGGIQTKIILGVLFCSILIWRQNFISLYRNSIEARTLILVQSEAGILQAMRSL